MKFARFHPPMRLAALAFGAVLALSLSNPALAQWKWKDKNGHVQYSDLPPPQSVGDADILQRPSGSTARRSAAPTFTPNSAQALAASAASAANGAPAKPAETELDAKRRKAAEEEAAKRRAEEEKNNAARAENCQRAKSQLRGLEDGMRMARVNAKGEREILDDKARAEETKRTRDVINSDCK